MRELKEAVLYEKREGGAIVCTACARRCYLRPGQIGFCGVRKNIDGKLYLLVYGKAYAVQIDPIEKKPLYHFYPGSAVLSFGTTGCSWACAFCCNYHMSQRRKIEGYDIPPEKMVDLAEEYECDGIAYTYNEPTIFVEYAHDIGVIARRKGLFNVFVTNGYMTEETRKYVRDFLDAATIDIKGNADPKFLGRYSGVPKVEPIFDTMLELKNAGLHIEVTDLVVPEIGDNLDYARKLVKWIVDNLGPETPVHFIRFFPQYRLSHLPPTPIKTLEKHYRVAKEAGLKYVYIGNVPGHEYNNTYCPECGRVVIRRRGFEIVEWNIEKGRCKFCGAKIDVRYKDDTSWSKFRRFWWII